MSDEARDMLASCNHDTSACLPYRLRLQAAQSKKAKVLPMNPCNRRGSDEVHSVQVISYKPESPQSLNLLKVSLHKHDEPCEHRNTRSLQNKSASTRNSSQQAKVSDLNAEPQPGNPKVPEREERVKSGGRELHDTFQTSVITSPSPAGAHALLACTCQG